MLNNSLDLLYIIIAFCLLWFTLFVCWWLFYLILIIRNVYLITHGIRKKLKAIEEISLQAKDRFEKTAAYIDLAADGLGKIIGYVKEKKQSNAGKNNKKTV
jgi:hypothetical protein